MNDHILLGLYVRDIEASARFYEALLDAKPENKSDNYAQFVLRSGVTLGLWRQGDVEPSYQGSGCRTELDFVVATPADVDARCARWEELGVTIVEKPTTYLFGYSLLGNDPDGHRLRVLSPPG